ncbi:MAG: ribosome-associated translation inhibitor RaiA [Candidatus Pacebacteria bacterium]|nr:ribosome-associated translation inhibitor RaiA [Candidatus Paceibacterota bacterium]
MNIMIKGTNLELHNDLKAYAEEKIGGLKKFMEGIDLGGNRVIARVELAKTTQHHQQGDIYKAEVNLQFPKKMFRSVVESDDIYKAIDEVKDELRIMINSYKEERIDNSRRGRRIIKDLKRISPLAWAKNEFRKIRKGKK